MAALSCSGCGGSGRWFDMSEEKCCIGYGEIGPPDRRICEGHGISADGGGQAVSWSGSRYAPEP